MGNLYCYLWFLRALQYIFYYSRFFKKCKQNGKKGRCLATPALFMELVGGFGPPTC